MQLSDKRPFCHQRSAFIRALKGVGYEPSSFDGKKRIKFPSHFLGPRDDFIFATTDLEHINIGEAYWRVDEVIACLFHYTIGAIHNKWHDFPNVKCQTPSPAEARERVQDLLAFGYEFEYGSEHRPSYGVCSLIDYANPTNNQMRYAPYWPGVLDDGFAWDLILMLNGLPVIAVLFSKKEKFLETAQTAYYQIQSDPCFGAYALWIVVTDGHESYVGTPKRAPEKWVTINHVIEELLKPKAFVEKFLDYCFFFEDEEPEGDSNGK